MSRLAILLRSLGGLDYLAGDLVHVFAEGDADVKLRITHVLAARNQTNGTWAEPKDLVYAPVGTHKDDIRLAIACHHIARGAPCAPDMRALGQAAMLEAFGAGSVR